jgi:hypothetical protein
MKKGSMTCKIPDEIKEEIEESGLNKHCCVQDETCRGAIQWHHAFTYAGKRQNGLWCTVGICESHHRRESQFRNEINKIIASRTTLEKLISEYPKTDLIKYF